MNFEEWLDVFIEEKGLDLDLYMDLEANGEVHMMVLGVVIEFIKGIDESNQKKIKDMLVKIDFMNGKLLPYFRHIARGMILCSLEM